MTGAPTVRRGRDPLSGEYVDLAVADEQPRPMPGSRLTTSQVRLVDDRRLVLRRLPAEGHEHRAAAERALDDETRALVRLTRRYLPAADGTGHPTGLARVVAYDFDGADPFVAVAAYPGAPASAAVGRLIPADQQRFAAGLLAALAALAAADLVHGSIGLDALVVETGGRGPDVQLVTFEEAVATGEPRRADGRAADPGDDVRAAVELLAVAFADARPGHVDRSSLASLGWLAVAADGVFTSRAEDRPSAAEVLSRLPEPVPVLRPRRDGRRLDPARRRFDEQRGRLPAGSEAGPEPAAGGPARVPGTSRPVTPAGRPAVDRRRAGGGMGWAWLAAAVLVLVAVLLVVFALLASAP